MIEQAEIADELVDAASITDGKAVVSFSRTEAALAALRGKYENAIFDLKTVKGDKAAREARKELVTLRTSLDRKRKELKEPAQDFSKKIDSEATRLKMAIEALEDPIDLQIRSDETRRENERVARETAERERVEALRARVAKIAEPAGRALIQDMSSADIALSITELTSRVIGEDFQEFLPAAIHERAATLIKLEALRIAAVKREESEAQAARDRARLLELERQEQERLAREAEEHRLREAAELEQRRKAERERRQLEAQREAADALLREIQILRRRAIASSASGLLELATLLETMNIGPEFGVQMQAVETAKQDTIAEVHQLHAMAVQREAEKREQLMIRAEQAAAQRRIDEQAAELARREAALKKDTEGSQAGPGTDGSQKSNGDGLSSSTAPAKAGSDAQSDDEDGLLPAAAGAYASTGPEAADGPGSGDEGKAAHADERAAEPAVDDRPDINMTEVTRRLGFIQMTSIFIETTLGIKPERGAGKSKGAFFREAQWPLIKAALIKHLQELPQ